MKKEWYISIEIPNDNLKLTIYDNGLVYGYNRNEVLFKLSDKSVNELKSYIDPLIPSLKRVKYMNEKFNNIIVKINFKNRRKEFGKIKGWSKAIDLLNIIKSDFN